MKSLWRLAVGSLALVLAFAVTLLGSGYFLSPQDQLQKSDAIVVISGGEISARVEEAARLYREEWAPRVVFSGAARSGEISNALSMSRQATRLGVDPGDALLEERSETTAENARFVAQIIREQEIGSIILVTSPYHQRRANLEFGRALGPDVAVINHSASDSTWRKLGWWQTAEGRELTFSELGKTLFVLFGGTAKG